MRNKKKVIKWVEEHVFEIHEAIKAKKLNEMSDWNDNVESIMSIDFYGDPLYLETALGDKIVTHENGPYIRTPRSHQIILHKNVVNEWKTYDHVKKEYDNFKNKKVKFEKI